MAVKNPEKPKCDKCGASNFMSTSRGTMCKDCGHVQGARLFQEEE